MKEFWNERFSEAEYIYGTEPNLFYKVSLEQFKPDGPALFPADGEGRNGVYAAKQGYDVTSFDFSEEGQKKALALAEQEGVHINYKIGDVKEMSFPENHFGLIVIVFTHFTEELRKEFHNKCIQWLKPGGYIIMEVFSQHHLRYNRKNPKAGGPKDLALLYTKDDIYNDFKSMEIFTLKKKVYTLSEGSHHEGEGAVVRFVGRKR